MDNELFDRLLRSAEEAAEISAGRKAPAARHAFPDPAALRERFSLTQERFAALLGVSVGTLRNWEQQRRTPEGPARMLLRVAEKHPEALLDVARDEAMI